MEFYLRGNSIYVCVCIRACVLFNVYFGRFFVLHTLPIISFYDLVFQYHPMEGGELLLPLTVYNISRAQGEELF